MAGEFQNGQTVRHKLTGAKFLVRGTSMLGGYVCVNEKYQTFDFTAEELVPIDGPVFEERLDQLEARLRAVETRLGGSRPG